MSDNQRQEKYLLVDSRHTPLARAMLESPSTAANWQILILDNKIDIVMEHEVVQMVGMGDNSKSLLGRIIHQRGDRIVVEPIQALGEDLRQNLRMPVAFDSFIYPLPKSKWKGRREVQAQDLSCGGIAFSCDELLERGEQMEIVIPITHEPLVLRCQILRPRPSNGSVQLYAAKFIDLCSGEESMVREAVFNVQLDQGRQKKQEQE